MKRILTILFLLSFFLTKAQKITYTPMNNAGYQFKYVQIDSGLAVPLRDTTAGRGIVRPGLIVENPADSQLYVFNGIKWVLSGSGGGGGGIVPGGPITTIPVVGTNPGTDLTSSDWIINTFYGTQSPTASLSGGGIFEFTSASTVDETLNWGAGRQSATQSLASIVVAGITQSFSQPSAPGTVTGTQDVTVTTNTSTTYNNIVTTTDSKTATASTTFTYESKYYIGFVSSASPSDADIIAALGTTAGGVFATSRLTAGTLLDPASSGFIIFAYPASFGAANIKINGLIVGYNLTTRSFTNASGYSVSYNIYVSPFETAGGVDYQVL